MLFITKQKTELLSKKNALKQEVVNGGRGVTKLQQKGSTHLTKLYSSHTLFGLHIKEVSKVLTHGVFCSFIGQNATQNRQVFWTPTCKRESFNLLSSSHSKAKLLTNHTPRFWFDQHKKHAQMHPLLFQRTELLYYPICLEIQEIKNKNSNNKKNTHRPCLFTLNRIRIMCWAWLACG